MPVVSPASWVKRYVEEDVEVGVRQGPKRSRPVFEKAGPRIAELLEESKSWTSKKQKLTAARLLEILRGEGIEVGYTLVKQEVREWKRKQREVFVPLQYAPGDLAVCFLDGHVRAFEHFGAVPHRIAYDNLRAAVKRVLLGSERELAARFLALQSHYLFEASFCRPYTGHDKGGVESRGKSIRWQHLVPIPKAKTLPMIAATLLGRLDRDASDKSRKDGTTIASRFAAEAARMLPLASHRFRAASTVYPRVSRRALVQLDAAYYSVPCHWASLAICARGGVDSVELIGPDGRVTHARVGRGKKQIDYRHYLPELARKPQAVRQVASALIAQLGEPFGVCWRRLVDIHGSKEAARHFARVCEAINRDGEELVARRLLGALRSDESLTLCLEPVESLESSLEPGELPECLASIEVEAGAAADYDALLGGAL